MRKGGEAVGEAEGGHRHRLTAQCRLAQPKRGLALLERRLALIELALPGGRRWAPRRRALVLIELHAAGRELLLHPPDLLLAIVQALALGGGEGALGLGLGDGTPR